MGSGVEDCHDLERPRVDHDDLVADEKEVISTPVGIDLHEFDWHRIEMNGARHPAAIVMIENAHKHLERASPDKPRAEVVIEAAVEVGPALFFSLLVITVSFLPIFALEAQEGRLFKPLAYTKTFAMAAAALLSVTLVPALMILFVRGRIMPEHKNPVNRFLIWIYRPVIRLALRFKAATILIALAVLAGSVWPAVQLGSEFMPNLNEGTLFYCRPRFRGYP
jgi:copper/silver efflux system protein